MSPKLEAALCEGAALALAYARGFLRARGFAISDELAAKALEKVRELIRQDPGVTNAATLIVEDEREHRIPPLSSLEP